MVKTKTKTVFAAAGFSFSILRDVRHALVLHLPLCIYTFADDLHCICRSSQTIFGCCASVSFTVWHGGDDTATSIHLVCRIQMSHGVAVLYTNGKWARERESEREREIRVVILGAGVPSVCMLSVCQMPISKYRLQTLFTVQLIARCTHTHTNIQCASLRFTHELYSRCLLRGTIVDW